MSSLFSCDTTNSVLRVSTGCVPTVAVITVDNFPGSPMEAMPITGYTLELSTNHQFLHSLDEFIYAFAFGDRIGELTITGIGFTGQARAASTAGNNTTITSEVKQENVYAYYLENKFSKRQGAVKIQIGADPVLLFGFLTGVRMSVPSPDLPIMQWALRFNVIAHATPGTASRRTTTDPARPQTPTGPGNNNTGGLVPPTPTGTGNNNTGGLVPLTPTGPGITNTGGGIIVTTGPTGAGVTTFVPPEPPVLQPSGDGGLIIDGYNVIPPFTPNTSNTGGLGLLPTNDNIVPPTGTSVTNQQNTYLPISTIPGGNGGIVNAPNRPTVLTN